MTNSPLISVIIPVRDGAATLPAAIDALLHSHFPRESWELITVDDASTDKSAELAARFSNAVVRLTGRPRGPAYARNRGFELSRGEIILFVDADVCVRPDALGRIASHFEADPSVAAVVGSYDASGAPGGTLSRYRNLRHQYQRFASQGDIQYFWPACGAIRRGAFIEAGMFDEWHYSRPEAEGPELGYRVVRHGRRIVLDPEILAVHLKRWTLLSVLTTDLRCIGVPWMRLLFQHRAVASTRAPGLTRRDKASTVLVWTALGAAALMVLSQSPVWRFGAVAALVGFAVVNAPFFNYARRARGTAFVMASAPFHMMHYLLSGASVVFAWLLHVIVGEPQRDASDEAFAEIGLSVWPPVPQRRESDPWRSAS